MANEQPASTATAGETESPPPPEVAPRTGTAAARWLSLLAISAAALTVTSFLEFRQSSPYSDAESLSVVILFSLPPAAILVGAVVGAGLARRGSSAEGIVRFSAVLGLVVGVGGLLLFLYGYGWSGGSVGGAGSLVAVPVIVASIGCLRVKGLQPGPVVPTNEGTAAFLKEPRQGHIFVCGRCGKPLSPYWRSCIRCKATFDEFPPVATDRSWGRWGL